MTPSLQNVVLCLRRFFCHHAFALRDLEATGIPEPENIESMSVPEIYESDHFKKRVRWPCAKCGKVFYAHCGLYISPEHGPVLPNSSRSQNAEAHGRRSRTVQPIVGSSSEDTE